MEFYEIPDTKETIWFVRMFDKAFDCLNGRNLTECKLRRKPDLTTCQRFDDPQDHRYQFSVNISIIILLYAYTFLYSTSG